MRETDIQRAILAYLCLKNVFVFRVNTLGVWDPQKRCFRKSPNTLKGVSDILGCWKSRFLAIEVKKKGNKPTTEQMAFIEAINKHGGFGFVAYSVDDVIAKGI